MRIVIQGGGIIGLSIGWQLAREGFPVEIFERDRAGRQASWAAAGMLGPYAEAGFEDEELLDLGEKSLALYPKFLQELSEDAGKTISFESRGTLIVGIDRDDRTYLERFAIELKKKQRPIEWIDLESARAREPLLSPRVSSAIWLPTELQIDNRRLVAALIDAFQKRGGILHEYRPFDAREKKESDLLVDASGAWTADSRVRPNKGQILTLKSAPPFPLSCVVRSPRVYLAPKKDGAVRIGATNEDMGFDKTVTAGAIRELLAAAYEIVPAVEEMAFEEAIASFRPATQDRLPLIEETEEGFLAVGHGRAGILLTPYTAYAAAKKIGHRYANSMERKHRCAG